MNAVKLFESKQIRSVWNQHDNKWYNAHQEKLYRSGFRGTVSRSTLTDANEQRDYRIYQDYGLILIGIAQKLHQNEELGLEVSQAVYALDSTTIDLCLSLFPWASFRERQGGRVKENIEKKVFFLAQVEGSQVSYDLSVENNLKYDLY